MVDGEKKYSGEIDIRRIIFDIVVVGCFYNMQAHNVPPRSTRYVPEEVKLFEAFDPRLEERIHTI
jgi:hypothetical protein